MERSIPAHEMAAKATLPSYKGVYQYYFREARDDGRTYEGCGDDEIVPPDGNPVVEPCDDTQRYGNSGESHECDEDRDIGAIHAWSDTTHRRGQILSGESLPNGTARSHAGRRFGVEVLIAAHTRLVRYGTGRRRNSSDQARCLCAVNERKQAKRRRGLRRTYSAFGQSCRQHRQIGHFQSQ